MGGRGPSGGLGKPFPASPRRLQEAEKQSRALQQELAALREELRARGPGGKWPQHPCLGASAPPQPHGHQETPMTAGWAVQRRVCPLSNGPELPASTS